MISFIKKHKLKFISYFLCAFTMALFAIVSFNCKTYAYSIDNNGNLVGGNLFDINGQTDYKSANISIDTQNNMICTNNIFGNSQYIIYSNIYTNGTYTINLNIEDSITNSVSNEYRLLCNNGAFGTQLDFYNNYYYIDLIGGTPFTFTSSSDFKIGFVFISNTQVYDQTKTYSNIMLNKGSTSLPWESYGVWYSKTNFDTINNLYDNALSQYNDLALSNNYGYWKYIDYVEFEESNNIIFVPNSQEKNEWSITDLTTYNILKVGGYFDTTPLTMNPYQSNYNEVDTHISFKGFTPSDSFIISFNHSNGAQVVLYDENSNSFNYTISEVNSLIDIDINIIRQSVPNFGLYIIDMYIRPNNAEQNGIYFANNDYITAYNKGYNVATSNADRKYIPQITDLQNQINTLNNNVNELNNNINTLKALNTDLQNQLTNSTSWQNLFFAFADTPFKVVSNVLGFELFGLNLFSTFIGMITVFGVVYLLKKFL